MISLNPFKSAYVKGLRADLLERFLLTLITFWGLRFVDCDENKHAGIFDLLTLGIPLAFQKMFLKGLGLIFDETYVVSKKSIYTHSTPARLFGAFLAVFSFFPALASFILNATFALVATFVTTPIVLFAHLVLPSDEKPSDGRQEHGRSIKPAHTPIVIKELVPQHNFPALGVYATVAPKPKPTSTFQSDINLDLV